MITTEPRTSRCARPRRRASKGARRSRFGQLTTAGFCFREGGRHTEAVRAYDRAFSLFERELQHLPEAPLITHTLSRWASSYAQAAFAALDAGDAPKALDFMEKGRSRLLVNRLGSDAAPAPRGADAELWARYTRAWRSASLHEVATMLGHRGPPAEASAVLELRAELQAAGIATSELNPVKPTLSTSSVCDRLRASTGPRRVVLAAVHLGRELRFVRATADGVVELPLATREQAEVLRAVEVYVASVRAAGGGGAARAAARRDLLDAVRGPLTSVLGPALEGGPARLVWIPHGSLIDLPLAACHVAPGGPYVVDRAAIVVAPSATFARSALDEDTHVALSTAAIAGRYARNKPPTSGGPALLAKLMKPPREDVPSSMAELASAAAGKTLVHLSCHGVHDPKDPLGTHLELGGSFDASVQAIFDTSLFERLLVVLATCDSGLLAQTDVNEALGIPAALAAAGAHAVIGSCWPVQRLTAVGICARVFRELASGTASPEALQRAVLWLREATLEEYESELAACDHPALGERELGGVRRLAAPGDRVFAEDADVPERCTLDWSLYMHWGGGWAASAGRQGSKDAVE